MSVKKKISIKGLRLIILIFPIYFVVGGLVLLFLRLIESGGDLFLQTIQATFFITCLTTIVLERYSVFNRWIIALVLFSLSSNFFLIAQMQVLNTDRSRSFYILSWVDSGVIQEKHKVLIFKAYCSNEMLNPEAISIRLQEQIERGFIRRDPELELTHLGETQLWISEQLARLYQLKNWSQNTC